MSIAPGNRSWQYVLRCLLATALTIFLFGVHAAYAQSRLTEFLAKVQPSEIVPGADRFGPLQGVPPMAPVLADTQLLGYAYVNADWVNSTGYSGRPIQILVGIGTDARITGAKLMDHHEPIILIGIPPERITRFIAGYVGRNVLELTKTGSSTRPVVDIVSGATVSVMVIGESIVQSGIRVARSLGLGGARAGAAAAAMNKRVLDDSKTTVEAWEALVGDGSVRRLHLTIGDVTQAFERSGNQAAAERPEPGAPDDSFIDLYMSLVSVPAIGRSLLGDAKFEQLQQGLKPGQQVLLIAADGAYSFKGSGYVRGGIFDRIEVIQGDTSVRFRDHHHSRIGEIAAQGAPAFHDIDLFTIPEGTTLDPVEPWRLQLLAQRAFGARDKSFLTFDLGYQLPDKYTRTERTAPVAVEMLGSDEVPLWQTMWRVKAPQIAVLLAALAILTVIFFFQDWLVRRPVLYERVRLTFLVFTLVWIGWYAQAQLSIVNVLAFLNALRTDFHWDYFLMAPLIFILWFATAASLLFWNRGAFCGWLCPFGALQELVNRAAQRLRIPQLKVPFGVHQRLVAVKYLVFLVLFGISLSALATAEQAAEVEPFKTAITLYFVRSWPFVLYAVSLLVASVFVERFFCRYMCPLGAALAIPARLRMFDWLRRYRECGNPCQRCANECPVQAIHPEGHINPNECIQCLHCQVLYYDDHKCPVMIQKRLKREKHAAISSTPPPLPVRTAALAASRVEKEA